MLRFTAWAPLLTAMAAPAAAQGQTPVILSAAPDKVAVTIYRDPDRGSLPIDRDSPSAFALIAETRTVILPPGEVTVRFEGVASGIVPQSAILFGASPRERNRDAALLSQRGLVDAFTGQRVILRRTDPATGETVEETATVRSAADRLVMTTPRGVEALYCSGLSQTLIYPQAPATLSAKPVLSMLTRDQPGGTVTITLAYIATGFDWDATYVGTLTPDGSSLSLLGWLTMASSDDTSFPEATTAAVAGRVNRSEETRDDSGQVARRQASYLDRGYGCWPAETTSDLTQPPPPAPPPPMAVMFDRDDIVVTARRAEEHMAAVPIAVSAVAKAENLGDLKLYRIPLPVTVAARSQKQAAFLVKPHVRGDIIYRARATGGSTGDIEMLYRFRNGKKNGLGDPLPAGNFVLYQEGDLGRMYLGEARSADKAIDEEVELSFAAPANVTLEEESGRPDARGVIRHQTALRNANPFPIRFEMDFPLSDGHTYMPPEGRLVTKPGKRVWITQVPPNGIVRFTYRSSQRDPN